MLRGNRAITEFGVFVLAGGLWGATQAWSARDADIILTARKDRPSELINDGSVVH
jgi:hypothetical protein